MPRPSEIFFAALDAPPEDRARIVRELCAGDTGLEAEVLDLLRRDDEAGESFLASPAGAASATGLGDIPARIGPHVVLGLLGKGGMGTVYLARQHEPSRLVAIKVLRGGARDPAARARFEAERQALALMEHPHVARIFDAATTDDGTPYFVMEFVPGLPIHEHVALEGSSVEEILRLFLQACAGVQHAHQKGVIHRDLKPTNILVARLGGEPTVKVIDFGIAKASGAMPLSGALTLEGQLLGTPEYMAPEQAAGRADAVDTRTDVHALGVILYELLTGRRPHEREELRQAGHEAIMRVIREEDPQRPSTLLKGLARTEPAADTTPGASLARSRRVAGDLDWIVMKALEKQPDRRYPAVSELADDVARHLADEPVTAGPPGGSYRLQKFLRRHRRGVAAASLALVGLLAGSGVAGWQGAAAREARQRAELLAREAGWNRHVGAVALADASAKAGDMRTARATLEQSPPEVRGFEWRHLRAGLDESEAVLLHGGAPLTCVARAGHRLVTADILGHVRVVDPISGQEAFELSQRPAAVRGLAVDPSQQRVAAARRDGTLEILDVATGAVAETLRGGGDAVKAACWHRGSGLLAAASETGVRLWSAGAPRDLPRDLPVDGGATDVTFAGERRMLVACTVDGLHFWTTEGEPLARARLAPARATCLAADPTGDRVLVGLASGELGIVDLGRLAVVDRIPVAGASVGSLAVSSSGLVLAGCADNVARVIDPARRAVVRELRGHENAVTGVAWLADGGMVTASDDGTLRRWGPVSRSARRTLDAGATSVRDVAFLRDGSLVTAVDRGPLTVWDPVTGLASRRVVAGPEGASKLAVSPDGRLAAAGRPDGTVRTWTLPGWTQPRDWTAGTGVVIGLAFDGRGTQLAAATTGGFDQTQPLASVVVLDVATGTESLRLDGLPSNLNALALDASGQWLAVGWLSGDVRVVAAATGATRLELDAPLQGVGALSFDPRDENEPRLWALGAGGELRCWKLDGDERLGATAHAGAALAMAWLPDASRFATTSMDRTVRLWSPDRTTAVAAFRDLPRHGTSLAFSPDGRWLATGSGNGAVELRDAGPPAE